jgi:hypothetical protein
MKIVYMYHDDEPKRGSLQQGSLPDPELALKPIQSLLILQRPKFDHLEMKNDEKIETFNVSMKNTPISSANATRKCSAVKLPINKQGQIVAYKPIFEPSLAKNYIMHMTVFECKYFANKNQVSIINEQEDACSYLNRFNCSSIVASWSKGSLGFVYPSNVGYAFDTKSINVYFLETHYEPFKIIGNEKVIDKSGIRFLYSCSKRKNNAGILSVGIQPVWTHIIPPGLRKVSSIGYCTGKATKNALADEGVTIIGIKMLTHEMGRTIKVRWVRDGKEHYPIAQDYNLDSEYFEYRTFNNKGIRILPGDDIIVECSYDSIDKSKLTLGGYGIQQEICLATLVYYPRQDIISTCLSKPKTKNFLKSLNIEKLKNSPPFTIELPENYAGRTLEEHLKSYNWKTEFDHFERISKTSPFDIICTGDQRRVCI